jgi:hypothetical protein
LTLPGESHENSVDLGFPLHWALAREFDPTWWIPNGFLLVYPLFFIPRLIRTR